VPWYCGTLTWNHKGLNSVNTIALRARRWQSGAFKVNTRVTSVNFVINIILNFTPYLCWIPVAPCRHILFSSSCVLLFSPVLSHPCSICMFRIHGIIPLFQLEYTSPDFVFIVFLSVSSYSREIVCVFVLGGWITFKKIVRVWFVSFACLWLFVGISSLAIRRWEMRRAWEDADTRGQYDRASGICKPIPSAVNTARVKLLTFSYKNANSMQRKSSWEDTSRSGSQIFYVLWNWKVHRSAHMSTLLAHMQSQLNLVHTLRTCIIKFLFIFSCHLHLDVSGGLCHAC
jgi:hypothetical protein